MAGTTTTLYIDDAAIRLMVTRGKRITKLASVPLETALIDIDSEDKEKALAEKLEALFSSNKIRAGKVILGVSGLHCLTRPAILPVLPKAMLQEAVVREARRVLPIPPEQLYISWQMLHNSDDNLTIFLAGIPRTLADTIIRVLHQAGLKPYIMDIKPLALARLAPIPTCIIVDVQSNEFDLVIMSEGIPHPVRTVPFAEGYLSPDERAAIISEELERTVQFFNTNNTDNPLPEGSTIFFSGEITEEPGLCDRIAEKLSFTPEQMASPFQTLKHLEPSQYLVNIGLAMKEQRTEKTALLPDFNALPEPYLPKKISTKKLMMIPAGAAGIAILLFLVFSIQDTASAITALEQQASTNQLLYERRLNERNVLTGDITTLESTITQLDASLTGMLSVLTSMEKQRVNIDRDLAAATSSLVADLGLGSLSHVAGNFGISGIAESEQEVIAYARKLDDTGRFKEITIQRIAFNVTTELYNFDLIIKLPER